MVGPELLETKDPLDHLETLDLPDPLDLLDVPEQLDAMEDLDPLDHPVSVSIIYMYFKLL